MHWQFMLYSAALLVAAVISAAAAFAAWRRRDAAGGLPLALLMAAVAEWSLAFALEAAAIGVPAKVFWGKIQYLGVTSSPMFLLMFALEFAHLGRWLTRRRLVVLWIIPLVTLGLAATNEWHHLIWTSFTPSSLPGSNVIVYGHGPWFWIEVAYFYLVVGTASIILIRASFRFRHIYRRQALALLIGVPFPWIGSVAYVLELGPAGYDYTPIGFALTGLVLLWNMYRLQLFDLAPVARDALIENMSDGMLVLDAQNRVADVNRAAQQVLGAAVSLIGQPAEEALAKWPEVVKVLHDAQEAQTEICVAGDPPLHLDLRISSLFNRRGRFTGRLIVWRDITERKQAQAQIMEQQRALAAMEERELMARELHDSLGQVLSYVNAQAQAALDLIEIGEAATAVAHLARLSTVAADANTDVREFILGMRATVSPEQGFFAALEQYLQQFSQTYDLPITLSWPEDAADDLLSPGVQMHLLRIIQEALFNTHKYAQAHSAQVIITRTDDCVQVVIADDGIGFSPHPDWEEAGHFGLEIMRERAASVGGTLEVRSAPGQGTQVIARLPLHGERAEPSLPPMRVLLVDDHPLVLEGLKNLLVARGVDVVGMAGDGQEAVELARQLRPDVILMDVQMPGLSGPEATRRIKAELPDTKIVMLSVSAADEDLFEAVRSGADGYLLKSLEADQFFSLLAQVARGEAPLAPGLAARLLAGIAQAEAGVGAVFGLSPRQVEVLQLVAGGMTYKEIGAKLYVTERTVRYHIDQIKEQLGVATRAEAVAFAVRAGLVADRHER
jgi:PAS domain S-box-containing protein